MAEDKKQYQESSSEETTLTLAEFLESIPPNQEIIISDLATQDSRSGYSVDIIRTPEIQLHCSHDACNGTRFYRCISKAAELSTVQWKLFYLNYRCSNCQKTEKTFALTAIKAKDEESGQVYKFGEHPPFGPPTPARLIKLIGPNRELFLKGRRCENQALGVGAFTYYRRVVENQKNRILDEIIKVAKKLDTPDEAIKELEAAKGETQFSKALSMVKKGIPQSLLINGHNPFLLLHSALSEGIHDKSDEECLELASSVRVILVELAERIGQALKDEAELDHALKTLLGSKSKNKR